MKNYIWTMMFEICAVMFEICACVSHKKFRSAQNQIIYFMLIIIAQLNCEDNWYE